MIENMRVGGEGRYFDNRAAESRVLAELTQAMTTMFVDALARGNDVPLSNGSTYQERVSDLLVNPYPAEVPLLFSACHLAQVGQYEASSKALLAYIAAVAKRFGESAAEALSE